MQGRPRIKIEIEATGLLHIAGLGKNGVVELAEGVAVADLLDVLKIQADHQKYVTAFINGEEKNRSTILHDKDKVTLLLPVGGG